MQELSGVGFATLENLFLIYMDNHARLHCKRWSEQSRCFYLYLGHWKDRPASSIKRFDVQQLHARLGDEIGHTTANRVIQLLRVVYNRCRDWELIDGNPAIGIKLFRLESRERFIEDNELAAFFEALQTLRYPTTRDFLLMCLLTGARRSNVAAMKWKDVNLDRGTWWIGGREQKNHQSQCVPLVAMALDLLQRRRITAASEYVFPSDRSQSGHITKPEEAWKRLKQRSGLTDIRIHDLRRTLATYQAITGANISIIAKTLNHKDLKSTAVYARMAVDPVRSAMQIAVDEMMRNSGGTT